MENDVLDRDQPSLSQASRRIARSLDRQRITYTDEVQRLLDASFAVIRESGSLRPPVGAIVRRAGLSNKAFYRHFRSKDELLLAVLDDGIRQLASHLQHRMAIANTPLDRVRVWIEGVLEQALNDDAATATRPFALSRARLAEQFPSEVAESERVLTALLRHALLEAAGSGQVAERSARAAEIDSELVYNLAMGWVERRLAESGAPQRAEAEHLVVFCLRALEASGAQLAREARAQAEAQNRSDAQ